MVARLLLLTVLAALAAAAPARAALGDPDPAFGSGGVAPTASLAQDGYLDAQGRVVYGGITGGTERVGRLAANGTGEDGAFAPRSAPGSTALRLAPLPDGGIGVATSNDGVIDVHRYAAAGGAADEWSSFSTLGGDAVLDLVADGTGLLLLVSGPPRVARVDAATGELITTQTVDGLTEARAVARDPATGELLVAGAAAEGAVVARVGRATTTPVGGAGAVFESVAATPAGVLAVGSTAAGDGLAARFDAASAPDPGYGAGGVSLLAGVRYAAVSVRPSGAAFVAGDAQTPGGGRELVLVGLDARGLLDPQVGAAGPSPGTQRVGGDGAVAVAGALDAAGRAHVIGIDRASRHLPDAAPAAAIRGPETLAEDEPGAFDATASSDPERALTRFEWDFGGDGTFDAQGLTVTRAFSTPGAHVVALRVTDAAGQQATASTGVVVSQAPPTPVLSESAVLEERRGEIRVRFPGTRRWVPLDEVTEVPDGTEVDAREGRVRLTAARDASGRTMSAVFYAGRFVFTQGEGRRPYVTLSLSGGRFRGCGPKHPELKVRIAAKKKRKRREIRRLWGSGEGRFRTKGRYASATIRGTKWLTIDRCDGVAVRVRSGVVTFRDLLRGRKAKRIRAGRRGFVPSKQAAP